MAYLTQHCRVYAATMGTSGVAIDLTDLVTSVEIAPLLSVERPAPLGHSDAEAVAVSLGFELRLGAVYVGAALKSFAALDPQSTDVYAFVVRDDATSWFGGQISWEDIPTTIDPTTLVMSDVTLRSAAPMWQSSGLTASAKCVADTGEITNSITARQVATSMLFAADTTNGGRLFVLTTQSSLTANVGGKLQLGSTDISGKTFNFRYAGVQYQDLTQANLGNAYSVSNGAVATTAAPGAGTTFHATILSGGIQQVIAA